MEEVAAVGGGSQASGTHGPLDLDPVALPPYQASGTHGPLDLDPVSDGVAAVSMSIEDVNAIRHWSKRSDSNHRYVRSSTALA